MVAHGEHKGPISFWIPISFALTGFLIGLTTGLSSSPVVKGLLPLVFGVLAGGGGFFAKLHVEQSKVIGVSLSSLALAAIIGTTQGIIIRDDSSWHDFWLHRSNEQLETIPIGSVNDANLAKFVILLDLRSQLQRTSLSKEEQKKILVLASGTNDATVVAGISEKIGSIADREQRHYSTISLANRVPTPADQERIDRTEHTVGY